MSYQEIEQSIIFDNVSKLVSCLTGFERKDENFKLCLQFALSKMRNHKHLTVNSHEIRRKISGLCERFTIVNRQRYADRFVELTNLLINDPLCIDHYTTDIQWSIIQFLFEISYNPVNTLLQQSPPHYEEKISNAEDSADENSTDLSKDNLIELLKVDNIINISNNEDSSDLSDWSDSEDSSTIDRTTTQSPVNLQQITKLEVKLLPFLPALKPPKKLNHYQLHNGLQSAQWLTENIQSPWWISSNCCYKITSTHPSASFCHIWNKDKNNRNAYRNQIISTTSEYCLQREIIWMFFKPITNKYFKVIGHNQRITINTDNICSINSVSLDGLRFFIEKFCDPMSQLMNIEQFCEKINNSFETATKTITCFAYNLQKCAEPIYSFLLAYERDLIEQQLIQTKPMTVLKLYNEMKSYFQLINDLHTIYINCILDLELYHPHICSMYLLSKLHNEINTASRIEYANLATSLYITSLKVYINIIDLWWTECRLEDYQNEFLIEKLSSSNDDQISNDSYEIRPLEKCEKKRFFIKTEISKCIKQNVLTNLLCNVSLQAGEALNKLYEWDRITEIRSQNSSDRNSIENERLYDTFLKNVMAKIDAFKCKNDDKDSREIDSNYSNQSSNDEKQQNSNEIEQFCNELLSDNYLLYLTFESALKPSKCDANRNESELEVNGIFKKLNSFGTIFLPIHEIIVDELSTLLKSRLCVINSSVMRVYREEFDIGQHLQNLRKVYLFEASDLMYAFYSNLFKQIENGDNWNNPFLLTVQLNGVLSAKFFNMNSLFTMQVETRKYHPKNVLNIIAGLSIHYANNHFSNIISKQNLNDYNTVFRFLLKIKWGLWILENLRFPKSSKKRLAYTKLTITELIFKRLALVRQWILYSIQSIHNHLMTYILSIMGQRLDCKINSATNLAELVHVHQSYIETIYDHCFQTKTDANIRAGIEELLLLITALRDEWYNVCYIEDELDGEMYHGELDGDRTIDNSRFESNIDEIEGTYINCHCEMAKILSGQVYTKNRSHLSGLLEAFNSSLPF